MPVFSEQSKRRILTPKLHSARQTYNLLMFTSPDHMFVGPSPLFICGGRLNQILSHDESAQRWVSDTKCFAP